MKTVTIHCDNCSLQLYYENTKLNKKDSFRTIQHVKIDVNGRTIEGDYCSFACFTSEVEELFGGGVPLEEDRLKALADSLGYELKKKPQAKPEEVKEEDRYKNHSDDCALKLGKATICNCPVNGGKK